MKQFHKIISWLYIFFIFLPFIIAALNLTAPHGNSLFSQGTYRVMPTYFTVPSDIADDSSLFVYSASQNIRIYIDGVRAGTYNGSGSYADGVKMPDAWYIIPIHNDCAGKTIAIDTDGSLLNYNIYLGDKTAIIYHLILINCVPVIIGIFLLLIGLIMFFYSVFMRGHGRAPYIFLGEFMIFTGFWLLFRSNIRQVYMPMTDFAQSMTPVCLFMMHLSLLLIIISHIVRPYASYDALHTADTELSSSISLYDKFSIELALGVFFLLLGLFFDLYSKNISGIFEDDYGITFGALMFSITEILSFAHYNHITNASMRRDLVRNEEKTAFLSSMSHAIRTPVSSILGMNSLIMRENKEPEILELSSDIDNAGQSLISIIDDILDISKINSGELTVKPVPYSLSSLLNDCYNMMALRASDKGLTFEITNDPDIPDRLSGDDTRIRQIIINLLTNAVKYTEKGGISLDIACEKHDDKNIDLLISVKDSGIGIKEENIPKLFTEYERLDEADRKNIEGTGLGLSITKHLIDLMHGEISVDSEYGSGSVFNVTIPQHINDNTPIGSICDVLGSTAERKKRTVWFTAPDAYILIVDDIEMNLKVLKGLLAPSGMHVDTAGSGSECLKMTASRKYDLIFMDHMMPGMDGIETFNHMSPNAPVIMLTANAVTGSREFYIKCGFADYLSKPVDEEDLKNMCLKFLPSSLIIKGSENAVTLNTAAPTADNDRILRSLSTFIDTGAGLSNCMNDPAFYLEMIRDYAGSDRLMKVRGNFSLENWSDYRVNVHSLKSTSRTLGMKELGDEAFNLEMAAKDNDVGYIKSHNSDFLTHYEEMLAKIKEII